MKNKLIVGLFGIALESVNFGVTALAFTQIKMLQRLEEELSCQIEYCVFSDDTQAAVERVKELLCVQNLKVKYIVRIKTGISGLKKLSNDIKECDVVIDLTYGDSFSDIYGLKYFFLYSLPKIISIQNNKCLIIGPQTIGPFYNKIVEKAAKYLLQKAKYIIARDEMSLECARQLTCNKDITLTTDLAMNLPYEKKYTESIISGSFNVGLNVSLLMWQKDSGNSNLKVQLSYQELIYSLLDKLKKSKFSVHLITHVYDKKTYTEYTLAKELSQKYDNTVLAPQFIDPIDSKSYLANLDCFIGSRMHATIGAFSAGVPVIPISYSRKFEGLYGTLGYRHCIDCSKETLLSALEKIMYKLETIDTLEQDRKVGLEKANEMIEVYYHLLRDTIVKI